MLRHFHERRLLQQFSPSENGPTHPAPEAQSQPEDSIGRDAGQPAEVSAAFGQYPQRVLPIFERYPQIQDQVWPQMQSAYGNTMHGVQQNYGRMLLHLHNYPGMAGAWPAGTFQTAAMYPYQEQSGIFPNASMPLASLPDAQEQVSAKTRSESTSDAPSGGFEDFPEAITIFATSTFRVTPASAPLTLTTLIGGVTVAYEIGADGVLKMDGRAVERSTLPFSLGRAGGAVVFASRTAGRFTFRSGAQAPLTRDIAQEARRAPAFAGLPSRFIKNRPSNFSIDPADGPVTVDVVSAGATKRYRIEPNGTITLPDGNPAPFTATRLLGAIAITPRGGTEYVLKNGEAEARIAVADNIVIADGLTRFEPNQESDALLRMHAQRGGQLITSPLSEQQTQFYMSRKKPLVFPPHKEGDVTGADAVGPSPEDQEFAKSINAMQWGNWVKHRIEGRIVHMSYMGLMVSVDTSGKTLGGAADLIEEHMIALKAARSRSMAAQLRYEFYQSLDRSFTGATRFSEGGTTIEVWKNTEANNWECFGFTRTVDGVPQRWLFSVTKLRAEQDPVVVTLRRADDPSTQINVELDSLFRNMTEGTPAIKAGAEGAMRQAEMIRASERADSARIRSFELPRDRPIGYIGLYDGAQNMARNTIANMPRILAGRGHTFVSSADAVGPVSRDPLAMMEESVTAMHRNGVRDFYVSLGVHGSMTGMAFRAGLTRYPLTPEQLGKLVDAHPDCRFTFDVIACHTGGLDAPNLGTNLYTELSSVHSGRVTVFVHTKQLVNNVAVGIYDGGRDWSEATSYYTLFLLHYLEQKNPDGSPRHTYGEAHVLADEAIKRALPGLDPAVIRSGVAGGERTARFDARPPLPGDRT